MSNTKKIVVFVQGKKRSVWSVKSFTETTIDIFFTTRQDSPVSLSLLDIYIALVY
jgi:hypothetical protein